MDTRPSITGVLTNSVDKMCTKMISFVLAMAVVGVLGDYHRPSSYISVSNHIVRDRGHKEFDYQNEGSDGGYEGDRDDDYYDGHGGGYHRGHNGFRGHSAFGTLGYNEEDNHIPKYIYKYGVDAKHTKDFKTHQEHREGDSVKGKYTVLQPDGKTRIVHYTADKNNGFHAEVSYGGGDSEYDFNSYN